MRKIYFILILIATLIISGCGYVERDPVYPRDYPIDYPTNTRCMDESDNDQDSKKDPFDDECSSPLDNTEECFFRIGDREIGNKINEPTDVYGLWCDLLRIEWGSEGELPEYFRLKGEINRGRRYNFDTEPEIDGEQPGFFLFDRSNNLLLKSGPFDGGGNKLGAPGYLIPYALANPKLVIFKRDADLPEEMVTSIIDTPNFGDERKEQYVYLDFDSHDQGACDIISCSNPENDQGKIPEFDIKKIYSRWDWNNEGIIESITNKVKDHYANYEIEIVNSVDDLPDDDYTTIYIGNINDDMFEDAYPGGLLGLANNDQLNMYLQNVGLIFSKEFKSCRYDFCGLLGCDRQKVVNHFAKVTAHEIGHTLGLDHTEGGEDIMQIGGTCSLSGSDRQKFMRNKLHETVYQNDLDDSDAFQNGPTKLRGILN